MYALSYSTPDRATVFVTHRTHTLLAKAYAFMEGVSVFHYGKRARYVGYIHNGKMVKP